MNATTTTELPLLHTRSTFRTMARGAAAAALGLVLALPSLASAGWSFDPVDVPGSVLTYANGNSPRAIVGEWDDADGNTHGFVLSKGQYTVVDAPQADGYTSVNGVNARGDRAGIFHDGERYYGYFWSRGAFTTLDPPGSIFSAALFVNSHGDVVGWSQDEGGTRHGYVWSKGKYTMVDPPAAAHGGARAFGLNDDGQVVGSYIDDDDVVHGFVMTDGVFAVIDAPGAAGGRTYAEGINNSGKIVGHYADADGNSHGYLLSDGVFIPIDVPGALWTEAYSINSKGQVVGTYEDADGTHGFVATRGRRAGAAAATAEVDDE